jgi:hypothetical protein
MSPLAKKITQMMSLQTAAPGFDPDDDPRLEFFRSIGKWIVEAGFVHESDMTSDEFEALLTNLMPAIGRFEFFTRLDTLDRVDSLELLVHPESREALARTLTGTRASQYED